MLRPQVNDLFLYTVVIRYRVYLDMIGPNQPKEWKRATVQFYARNKQEAMEYATKRNDYPESEFLYFELDARDLVEEELAYAETTL